MAWIRLGGSHRRDVRTRKPTSCRKLVRAAFGNNNVDTCARVCHSPTGYGLKTTLGESAGTQTFASVEKADVIVVIGANPTDGHPVFASRLKRRVRARRTTDRGRSASDRYREYAAREGIASSAALRPGTNVAMVNALAHTIVTEGLVKEDFVAERCDPRAFQQWRDFVIDSKKTRRKPWRPSLACRRNRYVKPRAFTRKPVTARSITAWA